MKLNQRTIIGGILGGLYALIFCLVIVELGGEGSIAVFMFPPFWPAIITSVPIVSFITIIFYFIVELNDNILKILTLPINIFIWILIGSYLFSSLKKRVLSYKSIWAGGIVGFFISEIPLYFVVSSKSFRGDFGDMILFIFIGAFIGISIGILFGALTAILIEKRRGVKR